jgi:hypothetical protein
MAKKNRAAVELGRKGGKARAKISPEKLSEIGKKAARARWAKKNQEVGNA